VPGEKGILARLAPDTPVGDTFAHTGNQAAEMDEIKEGQTVVVFGAEPAR
jgi:hypothetical protein